MALSVPGSVPPNTEFVVTAYVWRASTGDKVKLHMPDGLKLADGESVEKTIGEGGARRQVFWRLRSGDSGTYTLEASSEKARAKPKQVIVKRTSIFG
jgi:predicted secreted protein